LLRSGCAAAGPERRDSVERRVYRRSRTGVYGRSSHRWRLHTRDDSVSPGAGSRDPFAGRIPITIITGFLGSGKSTLLGTLLRHPAMNRAAVIVNEFGEVGIDHALLAGSTESMTLLPNGCLCCSVRTDLQETLRELFVKRR